MLEWLKNLWTSNKKPTLDDIWNELVPGDLVKVYLKDPKTVGIISTTQSLTYQRLDAEDLRKMWIEGFVIRTERQGVRPANIDLLELNVVKQRGTQTRLVTYLLLREEISDIKHIQGEV